MSENTRFIFFTVKEKVFLALFGIIALVLGTIGHLEYYRSVGEPTDFLDACYGAVNLFFLQSPLRGDLPISLEFARWLAPATLSYSLVKAFHSFANDSMQKFRLRKKRDHAILIGLDECSFELAICMTESGVPVVVVGEENSHFSNQLKSQGVTMIAANPADTALLEALNVEKAKYLYAGTQSDSTNIEIIHQTSTMTRHSPIQTVCAIQNPALINALYSRPLFNRNHRNITTKIVNSRKVIARKLVRWYGPDALLNHQMLSSLNAVNICIIGDSSLLSTLANRLAEIGIYGAQTKLQITLVCLGNSGVVSDELRNITDHREVFSDYISLTIIDSNLSDVTEHLEQKVDWKSIHCSYVCMGEIDSALMVMQRLEALRVESPVVITPTSSTKTYHWLKENFADTPQFRFVERQQIMHTFNSIFGQKDDVVAKAIHDDYVAVELAKSVTNTTNSSVTPWDDLEETLKDANRNQADHLRIKCRLITGEAQPDTSLVEAQLTIENVDWLGKIEHRRWVVEKLLAGWRYCEGEKDVNRRLSPNLVPWTRLTEEDKQKDRDVVLNIPRLLSQLESLDSD